jgi:hypothetical protein
VNDLSHVTNGCGPPAIDHVGDIVKALTPLRKPEIFDIIELMLCTINGCPVPMEDFAFDPDLPIYTDGSAMHIGIMALAVSAGAAFQIGKDGLHYVVRCQVPRAFPQSAVAAEHMAIHLVFRFLALMAGHRGATVISDCQAVVSAFAHPHLYQGYRAKFGGLWREPGLAAVSQVLKTPAHRTLDEAIAQNDQANWFGNDKADYWAKFALAGTGKDGTDYKEARQGCLTSLGVAAKGLAGHFPTDAIARLPKARRGRAGPRQTRSEHHFTKHFKHWACIRCGCSKKTLKSRQDKTSCPDRAKRHCLVHDTHRLFGGYYEQSEGIPN